MNESERKWDTLAVVIPCYNSGPAAERVIQACRRYTDNILAVNDGSSDDTGRILETCGVETIGWEVNRGKGAALCAGFKHLLGREGWEALITLDSDGQHLPGEIPRFMETWQETGADAVFGARHFHREAMPVHRYWANHFSSKMIAAVSGCRLHDFQCGYRLFTRKALEQLLPLLSSSKFSIETEMALYIHRLKLVWTEIPIASVYQEESSQRSTWKPLVDSWRIAKVTARYLLHM